MFHNKKGMLCHGGEKGERKGKAPIKGTQHHLDSPGEDADGMHAFTMRPPSIIRCKGGEWVRGEGH